MHIETLLPSDQIDSSQVQLCTLYCTTEEQNRTHRRFSSKYSFSCTFSSNLPGMPFCLIGVNVLFIRHQTVIKLLWKGIKTNKRLPPIKQSMRAKNSAFKTMQMDGSPKLKEKGFSLKIVQISSSTHASFGRNWRKGGKIANQFSHDRLCLVIA